MAIIIIASFLVGATLLLRVVIRKDPNFLLSPPTSKESILVVLVAILGTLTVWCTRFYERWTVWRKPARERTFTTIAATIAALFVMIEVFSGVTTLAAQSNVIPMTGQFASTYVEAERTPRIHVSGVSTGTYLLPGDPDIYETNERFFSWTLLDAVPVLRVPETLELKRPDSHPAGWRGGAFILTFKLLVMLPFVTFAKSLYSNNAEAADS